MKSKLSPVYNSDHLFTYGETFVYSALSDTVTIDVTEVGFETHGKKDNKSAPGRVRLRACGGLAHILATCIKPEDVFIIVGRSIQFNKREDLEVSLNLTTDGNDESSHPLILIRLSFDVSLFR